MTGGAQRKKSSANSHRPSAPQALNRQVGLGQKSRQRAFLGPPQRPQEIVDFLPIFSLFFLTGAPGEPEADRLWRRVKRRLPGPRARAQRPANNRRRRRYTVVAGEPAVRFSTLSSLFFSGLRPEEERKRGSRAERWPERTWGLWPAGQTNVCDREHINLNLMLSTGAQPKRMSTAAD